MNALKTLASALALTAAVATPALATTYTWLANPAADTWTKADVNWNDGSTTTGWTDADTSDAVFDNADSSKKTIKVQGARTMRNMTVAADGYKFNNGGPLNLSGTLFVSNTVTITPRLGLPCDIYIADGAWLQLGSYSANHAQTILGRVTGECPSGFSYPKNTHLLVMANQNADVVFGSAAGVTNDVGTISVRSSLSVTSGVVRVSANPAGPKTDTSTSGNNGGTTPFFVCGDGNAFGDLKGVVVIGEDAEIATPEETWGGTASATSNGIDWYAQAQRFAQIEIRGKATMPNVEYLNGIGQPAKLAIGGDVTLGALRLTQTTTSGSEVNLNAGGTLRLRQFTVPSGSYVGTLNLDGCVIVPTALVSGGTWKNDTFLGATSGSDWDAITVNVKEGGAKFALADRNAYCNLPLKNGTASGVADGGLEIDCTGAAATRTFVLNVAGSDYNGPTVVKGKGQLQVREDDALPATTALKVGPESVVSLNTHTSSGAADTRQTVARVEGTGEVRNNSLLTVTGGIAPVFDGDYGTLTLVKTCTSLGGTLEITGDANGCGCVKFNQAQSIAGLTLKMATPQAFAGNKGKSFYKVVDGPYTGTFAATDLPPDWEVRYETGAVYLRHIDATVITMR